MRTSLTSLDLSRNLIGRPLPTNNAPLTQPLTQPGFVANASLDPSRNLIGRRFLQPTANDALEAAPGHAGHQCFISELLRVVPPSIVSLSLAGNSLGPTGAALISDHVVPKTLNPKP